MGIRGRDRAAGAGGTAGTTRPSYPLLGVAAKAIVPGTGGEVLIIRRSPRSSWWPGAWDLPGGKMDDRERLADTLVREVREETGLTVRAGQAAPFCVTHFAREPFWVTCVTFVCPGYEGEVRLSAEHTEYDWVVPGRHQGLACAEGIGEQLDAYARRR